MSLSWKDTAATVSIIAIALFTLAVMNGFMENIESRYALSSFAIFLLAGITGLVTGTSVMMQRTWSSVGLYALSTSALVLTIINAFINSEAWLVALAINIALIWLEYVAVDLLNNRPTPRHPNLSARGGM